MPSTQKKPLSFATQNLGFSQGSVISNVSSRHKGIFLLTKKTMHPWIVRAVPPSMFILSVLFYSLQNFLVKVLCTQNSFWTITCFRGIVGSFLAIVPLKGNVIPKDSIRLLTLRSVLGSVSILCNFCALSMTSIFHTTLINSTSPLFTAFLGRKLASWNKTDTLTLCVGISGIVVIFYNENNHLKSELGILLALVSALAQSGISTLIKLVDEDANIMTFYTMASSVLFSLPGTLYQTLANSTTLESITKIEFMILVGIASYAAQWTKTIGLQLSDTWKILTLRNLEIVLALLIETLYFKNTIDNSDILGSILIVISCLLSTLNHRICAVILPTYTTIPPNKPTTSSDDTTTVTTTAS